MVVSSCEKMSSELSLTWDDHHSTLVGVFEELLETNTLVDCTIAAEGQYLKAHKIILSACSPYFQLLFSQENEKNPIVVLKDIKFQELKAMIDFIYRGKVKVPEERLGEFVDAAESLQIKGLGGDNRQKVSPQNIGNKGQYIQRRRSMMSALPRKRLRRTDFSDGDRGDAPQNEGNIDNKSFEGPSREIHVEAPRSCLDETTLTLSSATNSPTSLPSSISNEIRNSEITESVSFVKPPVSPCDEVLPNPESVVVKSEPEAMAEVYIPETDCYIEPKEEDIAEDEELEEIEGETNSELVTDQYPAFSAMPQATSTRPETGFVPQMPETSSSIGADPAFSSTSALPDRHLPSASVTEPSTGDSAGFGDGRDVLRGRGALEGEAEAAPPPPDDGASCPPSPSPVAGKRHACTVCGKAFPTASQLARHARIHKGDRPFVCEQCGKAFKTKDYFNRHLHLHTGQRPYTCGVCGKSFAQSFPLKEHYRIHTGERPFMCGVCGKAFTQSTSLNQHHRIHTGERPYSCGLCKKAFTLKGHLQEHLLMHTGERPCSCRVCGKSFAQNNHLKRHMRLHTGERPHRCDLCDKAFPTKSALQKHLRVHTDERPYKCESCGKSFKQNYNLQVHMRAHSGERPYSCDVCGKAFATASVLQKHQQLHTA